MEITRRKFFFFGLAAGVGLFLPETKIELVWDKTRVDFISEIDIVNMELNRLMPHMKTLFEQDDIFFSILKERKSDVLFREATNGVTSGK